MRYKILLTSTSFQDTPGAHHELLKQQDFDVINLRGPLKEEELLIVIDKFDGVICGDDEYTRQVLLKGSKSKLKVVSKYGIGLDKIDLQAAKELSIPVTNCPGVNQVTVAEHVFALLLSFVKNIITESQIVQNGQWVRLIGTELNLKTIGVLGTGNVGREVIKRAKAFGMNVLAYDKFKDYKFSSNQNFQYVSLEEIFKNCDFISLNMSLNEDSKGLINLKSLKKLKKGVVIINTARAGLIDNQAVLKGINQGIIGGYLTDVLDVEPINEGHLFLNNPKILITPHIGSRTYENVVNQGTMAVNNLLKYL